MHEYAVKLMDALQQLHVQDDASIDPDYTFKDIDTLVETWSNYWDAEHGGMNRAPKFPMPNNWEFLLHYGHLTGNHSALLHVNTTLKKMALGGIYDQLGGGFARYSVDGIWKVPHFEKMLYDNAQLLGLYAQAFRKFKEPLFLEVIDQTLKFVEDEWKSPSGLYYSALDADSEGEEGKYYVWREEEIDAIADADASLIKDYFSINKEAHWEHGNQILLRTREDSEWLASKGLDEIQWRAKLKAVTDAMLNYRAQRVKPGLDDKCLASWNALLAMAFFECAKCEGRHHLVAQGEALINAIDAELLNDGWVSHALTKGVRSGTILLDDQVAFIDALISAFELTGKQNYLTRATALTNGVLSRFRATGGPMLQTRPVDSMDVIGHKCEVQDNVIPASNSMACKALIRLAALTDNVEFRSRAGTMLSAVWPQIDYAGGYSNWLQSALMMLSESTELVVCGPDALPFLHRWLEDFHPSVTVAASTSESELPLFKGRYSSRTAAYVCRNKTCAQPVFRAEDVRIV